MYFDDHHRGSRYASSRTRGATLTRLITPLAAVALLAVTAWLEFDARAAERSRRAAADSTVREYARQAEARYSAQVTKLLQSHLEGSTAPARAMRPRPGEPLPSPRTLTDHAWQCRCGVVGEVLFTFRYDFDDGKLVPDRDLVAQILHGLARHVPQALPLITENANATTNGSKPDSSAAVLRKSALVVFDTVASQPFVITYALVADATNRPLALYGVATDPKHLRDSYERLARSDSLLPPSVAKGRPNDSLLVIRVVDATTGTILVRPAPIPTGAVVYADTLEAWLGGQVVTFAIRPEIANESLIGDAPVPPRPLQYTLLGVAVVLSLVGLRFGRRSR